MVKNKEPKITSHKTPEIEKLFPCEFPIKVFGLTGEQFELNILTIIRRHVPELREDAIQNRSSKNGKYTAITILIYVETKTQLDAIYQDLTNSPYVLMVL